MATWTTIENAEVAVGAAGKTALFTALRDNPQAIAEGASGAPKILNAAFSDGTLGAEKFQTGGVEEAWVRERIADASAGEIGTYVMAVEDIGASTTHSPNRTTAGSGLDYSAVVNTSGTISFPSSGALSGTWRLMGGGVATGGTSATYVSLWLRIS